MNISSSGSLPRNERFPFPFSPSSFGMRSIELVYAHAIAAETQAAARYRQFGSHLDDLGNDTLAQLFHRLAESSGAQALVYARQSVALNLPKLSPWQYDWLYADAPAPAADELVLRLMTRHSALQIAYTAGQRALGFFEQVSLESDDEPVRQLASAIVRDRRCHLQRLVEALVHTG